MEVIERKLDNGIPVLLLPDPSSDFFVHIAGVSGGSRYETESRSGISHFLEHMMFKGTHKRKTAQDIAIELEEMGSDNNAHTGKEFIQFYVDSEADFRAGAFEQTSDIVSDQIINSIMRREDTEKEKEVVFQEMARSESDPSDYVFELMAPMLYGNQAAGRTILGTRESVGSVTPRMLRYWHRKYFNKNNLVVVLGGKLPSENKVMDVLNRDYRNVADEVPPDIFPVETPPANLPDLNVEYRDIPQSHMVLFVPGVSLDSPQRPALSVMATILGGGMSSRLFNEIREKRGLAYSVYAFSNSNSDTGYAGVYGGVLPDKLDEAITVTKYELNKIATEPVSEKELEKAKKMMKVNMLRSRTDYSSLANSVAREYIVRRQIRPLSEKLELLESVTPADVSNAAAETFSTDKLKLAVVGPHKGSLDKVL